MIPAPHPLNCETCNREHNDHLCNYRKVRLAERDKEFLEVVGCASHSASNDVPEPIGMNSTDIMLLAHDEWKRREERKHNHPEEHWVPGFINGFLTDKKWGREYVRKIRQQTKEREQR